MPEYRSQGTVRFGAGNGEVWIHFVPHCDYLVKHEGRSYAAFLRDAEDPGILIEFEDENGNPIEIRRSLIEMEEWERFIWNVAKSAALKCSKIQVEVDMVVNNPNRTLTGITIPTT